MTKSSAMLRDGFVKKRRDYWLPRLDANSIPNAPINTIHEVFDNPQIKHLGIPKQIEHPQDGHEQSGRQPDQYVRHAAKFFSPRAAARRKYRRNIGEVGLRRHAVKELKANRSDMKSVTSLAFGVLRLNSKPETCERLKRSESWILTSVQIHPMWWSFAKRSPPGWPSSLKATSTCAGRPPGRLAKMPMNTSSAAAWPKSSAPRAGCFRSIPNNTAAPNSPSIIRWCWKPNCSNTASISRTRFTPWRASSRRC